MIDVNGLYDPSGAGLAPRNRMLPPPLQIRQPDPDRPTEGEGLATSWQLLQDAYEERKRRALVEGFTDPATGWPSEQGWRENAMQLGLGLGVKDIKIPALRGLRPTAPGFADRISTRAPWAKDAPDPHLTGDLSVGLESNRASGDAYAKNAELLRGYTGFNPGRSRSPDVISEKFINHVTDNILALHDAVPPDIRPRSGLWYDGANAIAHRWAEQFGISPRAAAGTLAAMSPQKDWFQNVDLARRALEIRATQGNQAMTPDMLSWAQRYVAAQNPTQAAHLQGVIDGIRELPFGQITDPTQQARWVRLFDEAHNQKTYPLITPEGDAGGLVMTGAGKPQQIGWGSFKELEKAMSVLADDSLPNISRQMGGMHKVRNFYNNIISPNAGGDVTIDTHAIAAGLFRPLAGSHPEVPHGLGLAGAESAATGSRGIYGLYAEAYRRAAEQRGVLPREMQSITWEAVRGLFSPEQKRNGMFTGGVTGVWDAYRRGLIDGPTARATIIRDAGGIAPPEWHGRVPAGAAR